MFAWFLLGLDVWGRRCFMGLGRWADPFSGLVVENFTSQLLGFSMEYYLSSSASGKFPYTDAY